MPHFTNPRSLAAMIGRCGLLFAATGLASPVSAAGLNSGKGQQALIMMASEMHLENGLPTKLDSARAHILYKSCRDNDVEALISIGSYWGSIIANGCSAMISYFDGPATNACPYVQEGKKLILSYGSVRYPDPGFAQVVQIYAQLKTAFKCRDLVITYSASGIMNIDQKDYVVVKPYPTRPQKIP